MNVNVTKPIPIEYKWVVEAYEKVRKVGKAAGIDEMIWSYFDRNVEKNLYVIWNRMSSGSYFPQAVREKDIPKKDGTTSKLGIPTLCDRIAQQVVKHLKWIGNKYKIGYKQSFAKLAKFKMKNPKLF